MAYNTRRSGDQMNTMSNVGVRRNQNPPLASNFVPGGQQMPSQRPQQQQQQQQQQRGQGFQNQSNGTWRAQGGGQQRAAGPPQQRPQGPKPQAAPVKPPQQQQQQQAPPQQQQQQPQQQPQQQQQAQQQQRAQNDQPLKEDELLMETDEQGKKKPFWANKGKISKKEKLRRRNQRLSKILQPKNAIMILNELVRNPPYQVSDLPQPMDFSLQQLYTASVAIEGVTHVGHGRSKVEAKSQAAEAALKYIVKNRKFPTPKTDDEGDDKMDGTSTEPPVSGELPWQHVASFALFKLLNSWGEDITHGPAKFLQGIQKTPQSDGNADQPQNKPSRKMPDNAAHMNPLMLLNQMKPDAHFEEVAQTGTPPHVTFTMKCTVEGLTFQGVGPNKKAAKKMAAFGACHKVLGVQYPPDVFTASE